LSFTIEFLAHSLVGPVAVVGAICSGH
jgi:hypothetical protein